MSIAKLGQAAALVMAGLASGTAAAQTKQTVPGAHEFIKTVLVNESASASVSTSLTAKFYCLRNGRFEVHACYPGHTGPAPYTMRFRRDGDRVVAEGCQTKVSSAPVLPRQEREVGYYNVVTDYLMEVIDGKDKLEVTIDWGNATIRRGAWSPNYGFLGPSEWKPETTNSVTVEHPGQALIVTTDDSELLDRIEYAMKFLKASCDATVETGF